MKKNIVFMRTAAILCVVALLLPMCVAGAAGNEITLTSAAAGEESLSENEAGAEIIASGSVINISGTCSVFGSEVTFAVMPLGSDEPIIGIGQTASSENDGSFSYALKLPASMEAGTYVLKTGAEQAAEPVYRYFKTVVGLEKSIVLTSESDSIKTIGGTLAVSAQILNETSGDTIIWSVVSGDDVVSISDGGIVTALKNGTAVIRATLSPNDEVYAEKTITVSAAAVRNISLSVTITGDGTINSTGAYTGTIVSEHSASYTEGSQFTFEAVAGTNGNFVHWVDERSNRILSKEQTLLIQPGTDIRLNAVFVSDNETPYVMFVERNNRIRLKSSADSEITVPDDPYAMGYIFKNWAKNGKEQQISAGQKIPANTYNENVIFNAKHEKSPEKYNVTISGANEIADGTYEYLYDAKITVTPAKAPAGKKFTCWKKDGKTVSYIENYTFYVAAYNTSVEAVYEAEDTPVARTVVLTMHEPIPLAESGKIAFFAERYLPEQYTMLETGIILKKAASEELTLDNADYKAVSTRNTANGQYTVRKAGVIQGEQWSARAYLIYKDGENVITVYSSTVVGEL